MNATARKTKPAPRDVGATDFDALSAASAAQHQHESHPERLERWNSEQYGRWRVFQDSEERRINAELAKQKIVRERLDAEVTLYIDYRTRNQRARADAVYKHLLAAINERNKRLGLKTISMYTLVNRDLRDLRGDKDSKIPEYHLIPYTPPK